MAKERRSIVKKYTRAWSAWATAGGHRPPDPPANWSGDQGRRVRRQVSRALLESGLIRNSYGRYPLFIVKG